MMSVDST